jgi:hypothetical protein
MLYSLVLWITAVVVVLPSLPQPVKSLVLMILRQCQFLFTQNIAFGNYIFLAKKFFVSSFWFVV